MTTWAQNLDVAQPDGGQTYVDQMDTIIHELLLGLQERLNVCGYWPVDDNGLIDHAKCGLMREIRFYGALTSDPTLTTGQAAIYFKAVGGVNELFWAYCDGTTVVKQLTSSGQWNVALADIPDDTITESQMELAGMLQGAFGDGSIDLIGLSGGVAKIGANAQVAATPTANAEVANGKYVVDQAAASNVTLLASMRASGWAAGPFLNNTAYQATKNVFVCAYSTSGSPAMSFYTGAANPPTTLIASTTDALCLPVKKNQWWKVTGATVVSVFEMY